MVCTPKTLTDSVAGDPAARNSARQGRIRLATVDCGLSTTSVDRGLPTSSPPANPAGDWRPAVSRIAPLAGLVLVVGLAFGALVWLVGASNPFTPAGYVGYLTKGAVLTQSRFVGTQRGPTSPGRGWLLAVTNVSITPYTYTEDFSHDDAVLSRDNLKIQFRVHTVWRIDENQVPAVHGPFQHHRLEPAARERARCDREGGVRQFHPRAASDICPRRGATAKRAGSEGRAHRDWRRRVVADPGLRERQPIRDRQCGRRQRPVSR